MCGLLAPGRRAECRLNESSQAATSTHLKPSVFAAPSTIFVLPCVFVVVVDVDSVSAATAYQNVAGERLPQLKQQTLPHEHLKIS